MHNIVKMSLSTKLFSAAGILLLVIISFFYLKYSWDSGIRERSDNALIIASTAADGLNGEMLKQLKAVPEDEKTSAYSSIKKRLNELISIDKNIRFAYFYTQKNGKLYLMVDSEPTGSADMSPPGQEYTEADYEYFKPFKDGLPLITNTVVDRWGKWKSILIPINDNYGNISSIFAIDYPADIWTDLAIKNFIKSATIIFLGCIILLSFFLIVNNQKKIKDAYNRYNKLINNSNDIIYKITPEGIFTFVSPAWTRLLGHTISEVEGHVFSEFVHPDDLLICSNFINKVVKTKKPQDGLEYRIRHKNGQWFWHSTSASPVFSSSGLVESGDCIAHDITDRKQSEAEIKRNFEQQKLLAEISIELNNFSDDKEILNKVLSKIGLYAKVDRVYIFEDDLEKKTTSNTYEWCAFEIDPQIKNLQDIQYDNKISEMVTSLDKEEIFINSDTSKLSTGLKEILLPQGIKSILIMPLITDGKKIGFIGFDQVSHNREWEKYVVNILRSVVGIISTAMEKDKHLKEIKAEKEKIQTIIQGIGDAVFVVDKDKKLIIFNKKAEELSGYNLSEAINKPYKEILHFIFEKNGKVNDRFINQAFSTGKNQEMKNHTLLVRKNGSKIAVADSAAPLKDNNGKINGCVVVFRDVSRDREIDQMKSEFISVASHQLKTPLAGIKWMCELLLSGKISKPDKKQKEYLLDIVSSNERMIKLVNDLLDVSHIETGKKFDIVKTETNIVEVVDQIIKENKQLIDQKKINIVKCKGAPEKFMINIDGDKIRQAFNNLINNAIKYSKDGGIVNISCKSSKKSVTFMIKDNGIGIPKHQQAKIFNKFFRADNASSQETDGTGLGLYITKSIIEAHDGKIWFESEEKIGSIFYFELPLN